MANIPQDQARTTATLALAGLGLVVLALAARPLNHLRRMLLTAMAAAGAVLTVPFLRMFFALDLPPLQVALTTPPWWPLPGALLTLVVLRLQPDRRRPPSARQGRRQFSRQSGPTGAIPASWSGRGGRARARFSPMQRRLRPVTVPPPVPPPPGVADRRSRRLWGLGVEAQVR